MLTIILYENFVNNTIEQSSTQCDQYFLHGY